MPPGHAFVGILGLDRDDALVAEVDLDHQPVHGLLAERGIAAPRVSPPDSAIDRGAISATSTRERVRHVVDNANLAAEHSDLPPHAHTGSLAAPSLAPLVRTLTSLPRCAIPGSARPHAHIAPSLRHPRLRSSARSHRSLAAPSPAPLVRTLTSLSSLRHPRLRSSARSTSLPRCAIPGSARPHAADKSARNPALHASSDDLVRNRRGAGHHRSMDRRTVDVYERKVEDWIEHRRRPRPASLDAFVARVPPGVRADVGCGPGWHSGDLGTPVVAFDAASAMAAQVRAFAPDAWPVVADLERLPFRTGCAHGRVGAQVLHAHRGANGCRWRSPSCTARSRSAGVLHVQVTSDRNQTNADDRFPGRHFTWWPPRRLRDVVEGAGFEIDDVRRRRRGVARRRSDDALGMLPDTVGPGMRVLLVGLNPSLLLGRRRRSASPGPATGSGPPRSRPASSPRARDPVPRAARRRRRHDEPRAARDDGRDGADAATNTSHGRARLERLVHWLRPTVRVLRRHHRLPLGGRQARRDRLATGGLRGGADLRHAEHQRLERAREAGRLRRTPPNGGARDRRLLELGGLLLERRERVVERLRERLDAFAFERRSDVVEVDAGAGEIRHHRARAVDVFEDRVGAEGRRRLRTARRSTPAPACSPCPRRPARRRRASGSTRGSSSTSTPTADAARVRPQPPEAAHARP